LRAPPRFSADQADVIEVASSSARGHDLQFVGCSGGQLLAAGIILLSSLLDSVA